jgi:hypothetical protein
MDQRTRIARETQSAIGRVLLTRWDPMCVANAPETSDEYEAYVGPVYRLLASGASDKEIARYLVDVETKRLGFEDTNWRMLVPVARKLRKVFTRLASDAPAT